MLHRKAAPHSRERPFRVNGVSRQRPSAFAALSWKYESVPSSQS
jgi:hypothetical protein